MAQRLVRHPNPTRRVAHRDDHPDDLTEDSCTLYRTLPPSQLSPPQAYQALHATISVPECHWRICPRPAHRYFGAIPARAAPSGAIMGKQVRAHNPATKWIWCHSCRTESYFSRADARSARKSKPAARPAVLRCPHAEQARFHLVTRPVQNDGGEPGDPTGTFATASASTGTGPVTR
jgi:hypothetical protein